MNAREVINQAEEKIFAVQDRRSSDRVSNIHDVLVEAFERIDARLERGEGGGIPTGFQDLDTLTGGLHGSELVDIGRPAEHGQDRPGHQHRRVCGHSGRRADVVCEPGNGPAGVGPAVALFAGADRRQQVPQRLHLRRRPQKIGRGLRPS